MLGDDDRPQTVGARKGHMRALGSGESEAVGLEDSYLDAPASRCELRHSAG